MAPWAPSPSPPRVADALPAAPDKLAGDAALDFLVEYYESKGGSISAFSSAGGSGKAGPLQDNIIFAKGPLHRGCTEPAPTVPSLSTSSELSDATDLPPALPPLVSPEDKHRGARQNAPTPLMSNATCLNSVTPTSSFMDTTDDEDDDAYTYVTEEYATEDCPDLPNIPHELRGWAKSGMDVLSYVAAPLQEIFGTDYCGDECGAKSCGDECGGGLRPTRKVRRRRRRRREEEGSCEDVEISLEDGVDDVLEGLRTVDDVVGGLARERCESSSFEGPNSLVDSEAAGSEAVEFPDAGMGAGRLGIIAAHQVDDAYNLLAAISAETEGETGNDGLWATSLSQLMLQSSLLVPENERTILPFDTFQYLSVDMNISIDDPDSSFEMELADFAASQRNNDAVAKTDACEDDNARAESDSGIDDKASIVSIGTKLRSDRWNRERIKSARFRRKKERPPASPAADKPIERTESTSPSQLKDEVADKARTPARPPASANSGNDASALHRRRLKMAKAKKVQKRKDMLRSLASS